MLYETTTLTLNDDGTVDGTHTTPFYTRGKNGATYLFAHDKNKTTTEKYATLAVALRNRGLPSERETYDRSISMHYVIAVDWTNVPIQRLFEVWNKLEAERMK